MFAVLFTAQEPRGGPVQRGFREAGEVVPVDHDDDFPGAVPQLGERLVPREELLRPRVRAPEVELAPPERRDRREPPGVERQDLEVVAALEEEGARSPSAPNGSGRPSKPMAASR